MAKRFKVSKSGRHLAEKIASDRKRDSRRRQLREKRQKASERVTQFEIFFPKGTRCH